MLFNSSSRIAVLDLTHGGAVIARKLKKITGSVTAIDVYRKLGPELLDELESEGIKTSRESLKASDFDFIVAPMHLDSNYLMLLDAAANKIPVLSHHQVVGQILSGYDLKNKTLIELTGTKAKTSTAILLADILSKEKKVISHTSRGLEDWSTRTIIRKGLSITPASILTALDAVHEAGIEFDVFISEVSLGGTGSADVGIITTITNDYKIANNTKLASDAKRRMILDARPGSVLVINNDALRFFGACRRDINVISFTDSVNASCNVYYESMDRKGGTIAYFLGNKHGKIHIREAADYDITSYKTAFVCATAAALALDIDASAIERTLLEFKGAQGRMTKKSLDGRILIDNSNSGMDIRTAEKALDYSKNEGKRIVMVLGEEAKEVCEGLDPSGVDRFIHKHINELAAIILVGERMKQFVKTDPTKIYHANDLPGGIELAKSLTKEKDIILSCVKCFR
ncbi:MAG: coenzyme F430 synthase [Candidatus Methanoperedens sp.]|uniref:coenzyme F430 synthase n=1 Tax=Candidatus Methanoperedens sp. BLZ2 TaxID=2035255 RepID=UPI000BE2F249|nr:coenzyme F430 synthase [Candidatus Methanoperedens sp. BLZ2]KAB2942183.1 MAG: coenzyme F430 synthase [Candidatus Methanoperedens sp.]MBZ0173670.1 coenzyme F430 synthase [Candidatus Methanoperedens nitroreducens]MCX9076346.1 coenzyme F430 synthase [Candidatus Methanoperedens sp.]